MAEQHPSHKKLRPREKQRRANVAKHQRDKKQNSEHKLSRNIIRAEKMLDEVKELAQVLRPFLHNGAIVLGSNWDQLMEDQISSALQGVILRPEINEDGQIVVEDGQPKMTYMPIDMKDQINARQKLIELFPKLIPETAKALDRDPLLALAEELKNGGGGKLALEVEVAAHEPTKDLIDGVATLIDNDSTTIIELDTANA
jgi:hypothetical protein